MSVFDKIKAIKTQEYCLQLKENKNLNVIAVPYSSGKIDIFDLELQPKQSFKYDGIITESVFDSTSPLLWTSNRQNNILVFDLRMEKPALEFKGLIFIQNELS